MKAVLLLLAAAMAAGAHVDGVVINATTGKPQAGAPVTVFTLGGGAPEAAGTVKSDEQGRFSVEVELSGMGYVQATHDGIVYTQMLQPGAPRSGVQLSVYEVVKKTAPAKIAQHMILLEPSPQHLTVSETFFLQNEANTTYHDPQNGSFVFYVPDGVQGELRVNGTAPQSFALQYTAEPTGRKGWYKVAFPVKPGESRLDVTYVMPPSETFATRFVNAGDKPRLVAPNGVTLSGEGVQLLGQEPRTQASIYGAAGPEVKVSISGTGTLASAAPPGGGDEEGSGQGLQQIHPRIYDNFGAVLGLALAILACGFVLLYRKSPSVEAASAPASGKRRA
jgi:hypothetical protein